MSLYNSDNSLFELITAFVDGEATSDEIIALENLRRDDKTIDQAIDAEIQIRHTLRHKCRKIPAPQHLESKCLELLRSEKMKLNAEKVVPKNNSASVPNNIYNLHPSGNPQIHKTDTSKQFFKWFVAASVFFSVGLLLGQYMFSFQTDELTQSPYTYAVEDLVKRHFSLASDIQLNEINSIHTPIEAEKFLNARMGFELTVPELENATFIGAEMSEFVPGYSTPLLKYAVSGQDDPIHIFAFPIDKMDGDVRLIRDIEAIKKCKSASDTYIKDIDGKHIVSWKWGNVWYVGVSNHHGEVLASMLPTSK